MIDFTRQARKTAFVLFIAQSFASAGFIAAAAINPILGEKLPPTVRWRPSRLRLTC